MFKTIRILAIISFITAFSSCKDNPKNEEKIESEIQKEIPKKKELSSEPIKDVTTNFGGNWVNKKYVDRLLATKSPKKSQDISPITMVILPNQLNQKATTIIEFHEGTTGKVVKKNGGFAILGEEAEDPELTFKYENGKLIVKNDEFVKLKSLGNISDYKVVEQILFSGTYEMDGKKFELTSDGKIMGLDSFTHYSIPIDYYDSGMQVDQIKLGKGGKDDKLYGFEFKKNKLIVYDLKCVKKEGEFCQVVKNGKKIFEMIKE